jgi:hypothetical protein
VRSHRRSDGRRSEIGEYLGRRGLHKCFARDVRHEKREDRFASVSAMCPRQCRTKKVAGFCRNELNLFPRLPGPFSTQATDCLAIKNRICQYGVLSPRPIFGFARYTFMPETSYKLPIVIATNSLERRMYPLYSELTPLYLN